MKIAVKILCLGFVFILVSASAASAQSFGAEEVVKAARFLEEKPFDKEAKNIRAFGVQYVIETEDVTVVLCGGDVTKHFLDKKNKNSTELIGQYTIAMAAFKLQNPDKKDNENAAQLAGLESVLKTYEAMIAQKPKTKHKGMDEYVQKRNSGELKALVDAADCGKK